MANLTVTIDDDLLRRARLRAMGQGSSINALLRDYLEAFAGAEDRAEACRVLLEISGTASSGSGSRGRSWTRDQAHER